MILPRTLAQFAATCLFAVTVFAATTVQAETEVVRTKHRGLNLNGNLMLADGKTLEDGVVLLTHGTFAHNEMELIAALQGAFAEREINSLAITLSLGVDTRSGMYDCGVAHYHKHEDALDEIGVWVDWLSSKGAGDIALMGHSRGGNQTAWFATERASGAIKHVILLAPATWSEQRRDAGYEKSYGTPLEPIFDRASALVEAGKGEELLSDTGFVYCPGTDVSAETFVSYYKDEPRRHTPALLGAVSAPVLVIAGSLDTTVVGLIDAVEPMADGERITLSVIEDADHFFLDFFAEDAADVVMEFIAP